MTRLQDCSESSANATSRTLSGDTSSSPINSTHKMYEIKTPHVAHINSRAQDPKEALRIVRSLEPTATSNGKVAFHAPDSHAQALWIHLPANCRSWAEETIAKIGGRNSSPADLEKKHVLRDEIWKDACDGRGAKSTHARFMKPLCAQFSSDNLVDHESDDSAGPQHKATNVALYLPYLHWEDHQSWLHRQDRILKTEELHEGIPCGCFGDPGDADGLCTPDSEEFARQSRPLHHRRTLDHFYFYNISNLTSAGNDQVIKTHNKDNPTGFLT